MVRIWIIPIAVLASRETHIYEIRASVWGFQMQGGRIYSTFAVLDVKIENQTMDVFFQKCKTFEFIFQKKSTTFLNLQCIHILYLICKVMFHPCVLNLSKPSN